MEPTFFGKQFDIALNPDQKLRLPAKGEAAMLILNVYSSQAADDASAERLVGTASLSLSDRSRATASRSAASERPHSACAACGSANQCCGRAAAGTFSAHAMVAASSTPNAAWSWGMSGRLTPVRAWA